eukprot:gene11694-11839_t
MGDLLLSLLLTMKHNGAVEKSQAGFLGLAARLLQSQDPGLNGLPSVWLQRCLARVDERGQCRDDIVRRSAGLPFAMAGLFLAEPLGVPRSLLPVGLTALLKTATDDSLPEPWPRGMGAAAWEVRGGSTFGADQEILGLGDVPVTSSGR